MVFEVLLMLVGSGLAALGLWLFMAEKPRYAVVVRTAGGELQAYVIRNRDEVEQIVDALGQAFADRG